MPQFGALLRPPLRTNRLRPSVLPQRPLGRAAAKVRRPQLAAGLQRTREANVWNAATRGVGSLGRPSLQARAPVETRAAIGAAVARAVRAGPLVASGSGSGSRALGGQQPQPAAASSRALGGQAAASSRALRATTSGAVTRAAYRAAAGPAATTRRRGCSSCGGGPP